MGVASDTILLSPLPTSLQAETKKGTFFSQVPCFWGTCWCDVLSNGLIKLVNLLQAWILWFLYVELWIVVKYLSFVCGFLVIFHFWVELVYFDFSNLEMYFFLSSPILFFIWSNPVKAFSNVFGDSILLELLIHHLLGLLYVWGAWDLRWYHY